MIQLKAFIIETFASLGINTWDEALLIHILLIARYFFSYLANIEGEPTLFFQEAAKKTMDFLNSHNLSIPPELKLEEETTQKALYKLGSETKSFHNFGQLYGHLINPFSGNLASSSTTPIYDHLLWAYETIKDSQAADPKEPILIPSFEAVKAVSEEKQAEARKLSEEVEIIRLLPNAPVADNDSIIAIDKYCKTKSIPRETAVHLLVSAYCDHATTWNDACSTNKSLETLSKSKKTEDLFSMIANYCQIGADPIKLVKVLLYPPLKDESGFEVSYINTQVLKHSKKKTAIVIDPAPDLVHKLTDRNYAFTVVLSNPDLVRIYRQFFSFAENISFCNLEDFTTCAEQCCMVCFQGNANWTPKKSTVEKDQKCIESGRLKMNVLSNIPDGSIALVVMEDTTFSKGKKTMLREWARHGLLLYGILILPTFKTSKGNEQPKKNILLFESNSSKEEYHYIEILKMAHSSFKEQENARSALRIIHKHVFLPYSVFLDSPHPVRTIYRLELKEQTRVKPFRERPASESLTFIEEIKRSLHCTRIIGPRSRNNPFVYKLSYPHAKKKIDKHKEIRPIRRDLTEYSMQASVAKTAAAKEIELEKLRKKVWTAIDSMLYEESYKPEIVEDIRSAINERRKKDKKFIPSLKALNYIFQRLLAEGRYAYNPKLCQEMFSMSHPKLSTLIPDSSCTQETYVNAVREAYPEKVKKCPECDWTNSSKTDICEKCSADISKIKSTSNDRLYHDLFKQILLILRVASDYDFPVDTSPIRNLVEEYASRTRLSPEQQAARNALALKAFTDEQELRIAEFIFQRNENMTVNDMAKRMYSIIRYFLPCEPDEIRALNWGDYIRFNDINLSSLIIYKKATDNPDKPEFYANTGKKLKFRHLPVPDLLVPMFEIYKQMLLALDPEACFPEKPLLQLTEKSNGKLQRITSKQTSIYDKFLNQASGRKDIHQEKTLPGKKNDSRTDLFNKRSRLFESNWKYRVKEVGMTNGESSYLRGVQASTTYDIHYCDYSNQFILLMMALKLNRWVNQVLLSVSSSDLLIHGQKQQMTYCRLSDFSEKAALEITGCNYGAKVTITYDDPEQKKG